MPQTYSDIYINIRRQLRDSGIEAYGIEARLLVAHAAGKTAESLMRDLGLYTSDEVVRRSYELLGRRLAGEPVAYITGEWEFYGIPLKITPDVLIPRSDTEVLVDAAVSKLHGKVSNARVLDLCCGSGCVGCAVAKALPGAKIVMVDVSEKALSVAQENVNSLDMGGRVLLVNADAMQAPPMRLGAFDMIVCNPPYIRTEEIDTLDESVKDYEPHLALDGGEDGLKFYRNILNKWKGLLNTGGYMAFEVGEDQAEDVARLMWLAGFKGVELIPDTANIDRVVIGRI